MVTSVGSGTFFGLAMLLLFPLTAPKVVGTDITHAAALLWVAGVGHLVHGNVNLHAMAWLLVGSIPGVLLGSQMSISIPERSLRFSFGLVLILSGIKLVDVPHSTLIIVVSLAVAVAALIVYVAKHGLAHSLPGAGEPTAAVDVHSPERVPAQAPLDGSSVRAAGSHGSSVRRH